MPVMNFDLEDGLPPVSFSLKTEDCERFVAFMAECQAIRDAQPPAQRTPEEILDWLADQHRAQCGEDRPIQEWIRKMKGMLP